MRKAKLALLIATLAVGTPYGIHRWTSSAVAAAKAEAPAGKPDPHQTALHYEPGSPQLAYVRVAAVVLAPVPAAEPFSGRVAYDDDVTAKVSAPIAGRVLRIVARPGDRVKAGQPLLWLDAPDYAQAAADLRRAEGEVARKRQAFERARTLYDGEVLARKDYETAAGDLDQARIEAARARARFHNLAPGGSIGVADFALRAPLGGVVTERQVNPGSEVRADGQTPPLFVVSDPTRLWVIADLPEKDLGKVRVGQAVSIQVDAYPGERFAGTVDSVGEVVDAGSRRVPVRVRVANPDRRLKPEMFARVTPLAGGQDLPVVPNTAVVTEGLYSYVFVETAPGVLEKRRVNLSHRGHDTSNVGEGLAGGERVATTGAVLLNAELSGG